jgi:hypothetical protein
VNDDDDPHDDPTVWQWVMDGETSRASLDTIIERAIATALDDFREQLADDDDLTDDERARVLAYAIPRIRTTTAETMRRLHAKLQH